MGDSVLIKDAETTNGNFVVEEGETKTLNTRTYEFNSITVKQGGTLLIKERSRRWCILHVNGDVTIHGAIICRSFRNGPRDVVDVAPNGRQLAHQYINDNMGGYGGRGGISNVNGAPRQGVGGVGASPSKEYGGGGGSGAGGRTFGSIREVFDGNAGQEWRGGALAQYGNAEGGNGAKADNYSNGGLLYIFCGGNFDGANGVIDIRGVDGTSGENGGNGLDGGWRDVGAGGGGGGAPGGEGGHLIVECSAISIYPQVIVDGGSGGNGGRAGSFALGAQDGRTGEDGAAGLEDWFE